MLRPRLCSRACHFTTRLNSVGRSVRRDLKISRADNGLKDRYGKVHVPNPPGRSKRRSTVPSSSGKFTGSISTIAESNAASFTSQNAICSGNSEISRLWGWGKPQCSGRSCSWHRKEAICRSTSPPSGYHLDRLQGLHAADDPGKNSDYADLRAFGTVPAGGGSGKRQR